MVAFFITGALTVRSFDRNVEYFIGCASRRLDLEHERVVVDAKVVWYATAEIILNVDVGKGVSLTSVDGGQLIGVCGASWHENIDWGLALIASPPGFTDRR